MSNSQEKLVLTPAQDEQYQGFVKKLNEAKSELGRSVLGQDELLELIILTFASGGHALFVGVPGAGKTVLASSLGQVFGLSENRVQCTPDLMPSDILGTEVLEMDPKTGERNFRFIQGPIFTQLLMSDELNRASPRTQSAMLQGMQEGKVSAGGKEHRLPKPFHNVATQNPIDQEGTNPLPEAQKDRFLIEYILPYPTREAEGEIALKTTTTHHSIDDIFDRTKQLEPPANLIVSPKELKQVFTSDELIRLQHLVRKLPIPTKVYDAVLDLVRGARPEYKEELKGKTPSEIFNFVANNIDYGPGTRAVQAFFLMTKARALRRGDYAPNLDDVTALAPHILRHRIIANHAARSNFDSEEAIRTDAQVTEKIIGKLVKTFVPG